MAPRGSSKGEVVGGGGGGVGGGVGSEEYKLNLYVRRCEQVIYSLISMAIVINYLTDLINKQIDIEVHRTTEWLCHISWYVPVCNESSKNGTVDYSMCSRNHSASLVPSDQYIDLYLYFYLHVNHLYVYGYIYVHVYAYL